MRGVSGSRVCLAVLLWSAIPVIRAAFGVTDGNDHDLILPEHVGDVAFFEAIKVGSPHLVASDAKELRLTLDEVERLVDLALKIET